MREIVERVVGAARRRGAKHSMEVRLPPDLPMIRADAKLVEQALGNVVGNAITHTPPDTRIVVDGEATPAAVLLRVTDDGPGIGPDMLPHAFEKFARGRSADGGVADGGESTGLGLAIAKGIMQAHGGAIEALSPVAKGRGTRVTLRFPREEAPP